MNRPKEIVMLDALVNRFVPEIGLFDLIDVVFIVPVLLLLVVIQTILLFRYRTMLQRVDDHINAYLASDCQQCPYFPTYHPVLEPPSPPPGVRTTHAAR